MVGWIGGTGLTLLGFAAGVYVGTSRESQGIDLDPGVLNAAVSTETLEVAPASPGRRQFEALIRSGAPAPSRFAWVDWVEGLPSRDIEAATAWTGEIDQPFTRDFVLRVLLGRWIELELEAALRWIRKEPELERRDRLLWDVVAQLLVTTPHDALALASTLDGRLKRLRELYSTWAAGAAQPAAASALLLSDGLGQQIAIAGVAEGWATVDPFAAFEWLQSLARAEYNDEAYRYVLSAIGELEPSRAREFARAAPEPIQELLRVGPDGRYVNLNPGERFARALESVATVDVDDPDFLMSAAYLDPRRAAQWVRDAPDAERAEYAWDIAFSWAKSDRDAALDWALSLDERSRDEAVSALSEEIAKLGRERAEAVSESVSKDVRLEILGYVAMDRAEEDPALAARWVQTRAPEEQAELMQYVAGEWAASEPDAAAEFANAVEDEAARAAAVAAVSQAWSRHDPRAAVEWLVDIEHDDSSAIRSTVLRWFDREPLSAAEWLTQTADEDFRALLDRGRPQAGLAAAAAELISEMTEAQLEALNP
ncbi:MAG: hypothetical protein AAFZ38_11195 [Myxococcota bacterium]